jgi:hypothetical protein
MIILSVNWQIEVVQTCNNNFLSGMKISLIVCLHNRYDTINYFRKKLFLKQIKFMTDKMSNYL